MAFRLVRCHIVRVRRMSDAGKRLHAAIVRQFLWRVLPVAPACKVTTRQHLQVTADLCGKLVDQLNHFDWLQDDKRVAAVSTAHSHLNRAATARPDCDRACAAQPFADAVKMRAKRSLIDLFLNGFFYCGFHDTFTNPPPP